MSIPESDPSQPNAPRRRDAPLATLRNWLLGVLLALGLVWFLRASMSVTMPLACALLLALAVWPVARGVREHVPDKLSWLGPTAALFVLLVVLGLFLTGVGIAIDEIMELARQLGPSAQQRLDQLGIGQISQGFGNGGGGLQSYSSQLLSALGLTAQAVIGILLVLFLAFLLLAESRSWHAKIRTITADGEQQDWSEVGASIGQKFRAYFVVRLILGALTAILYVSWLALFGIDHLILWGTLTVLLNFIPTVGSIISGALPVAFALVTRDAGTAIIIAAGLFVIEQIMGNLVDPKITGRRLSVSPFVVLVSLTFWSWLWGIPGALLAVPLTVLLTMILAHFDRLRPIALFLTSASTYEELDDYRRSG